MHNLIVASIERDNSARRHLFNCIFIQAQRSLENLIDGAGNVIGGDAVDGEIAAVSAAVDDHQLTLVFSVLLVRLLERQADRTHLCFARRQPVAGFEQIEVPGMQAVWAVVAIHDTR